MDTDVRLMIRNFLIRSFPNLALGDDDDIFARGLVNSLFALQLIIFIEKEFALKIPNEDLEFSNFRTISSLSALVERLTGAGAHA